MVGVVEAATITLNARFFSPQFIEDSQSCQDGWVVVEAVRGVVDRLKCSRAPKVKCSEVVGAVERVVRWLE